MTKINTTHGIDLQLFADAGSLVNGTAGFVNASTGVTSAFDTSPPTTTARSSGASGTAPTAPRS